MKKILSLILCLMLLPAMVLNANAEEVKPAEYRVFAGERSTFAIDSMGEILFTGGYDQEKLAEQVPESNDIIDIAEKIGLVYAIDNNGKLISKYTDSEAVYKEWGKFIAVENGGYGPVCLREDNTVVAITSSSKHDAVELPWENIVDMVDIQSSFYPGVCAIDEDGNVFRAMSFDYNDSLIVDCGQVKPELFKDIVKIDTAYDLLVGLKSDGTIVGTNFIFEGMFEFKADSVSEWTGIVDIAVIGETGVFGLKEDGTVITNCTNETMLDAIKDWKNIVALYSGEYHIVALRNDGKLLTAGNNEYGQCNVGDWNLNPLLGDANDDGKINASDALKILKVAAKIDVPEEGYIPGEWSVKNAKVADNKKENISADDAFRILEHVAHINIL